MLYMYFEDDTLKGLLFHLLTAPCKALQISNHCNKTVTGPVHCSQLHNIAMQQWLPLNLTPQGQ